MWPMAVIPSLTFTYRVGAHLVQTHTYIHSLSWVGTGLVGELSR